MILTVLTCIVLYLLGNQLEVPTGTMMKHVIEHKYVYLLDFLSCVIHFQKFLSENEPTLQIYKSFLFS